MNRFSFYFLVIPFLALQAFAQPERPTLQEVSQKANKSLPEIYDHVTKLMSTSVENNHFVYHFIVDANHEEYTKAMPKVRTQVLKTICSKSFERSLLLGHKASIVYRYENVKGMSLGEFVVRPEHCGK